MFWGAVTIIVSVVWFGVVRNPQMDTREEDRDASEPSGLVRNVLKNRSVWILSGVFFANNALFYIETGWLKQFFDFNGADPALSILLVSILAATIIPTVLIAPSLSDRVGLRRPFLISTGLVSALAAYGLSLSPISYGIILTILLGVSLSYQFVLCLTLPIELVKPQFVGAAAGLSASIGYGGGVLGPYVTGLVIEFGGGFDFLPVLLILLSLVTSAFSVLLPETGWKAHSEPARQDRLNSL